MEFFDRAVKYLNGKRSLSAERSRKSDKNDDKQQGSCGFEPQDAQKDDERQQLLTAAKDILASQTGNQNIRTHPHMLVQLFAKYDVTLSDGQFETGIRCAKWKFCMHVQESDSMGTSFKAYNDSSHKRRVLLFQSCVSCAQDVSKRIHS
jgi:hypothetical protein